MSKTFRCKRSGNCVTFHLEGDIQGMLKHEGYEEVNVEAAETVKTEPTKAPTKEVLKLKKNAVPAFLQE
jgi:hypothetical protein